MATQIFLFQPGIWIGEGKVTFAGSPDQVNFYTKWTINEEVNQTISCRQEVEMRGGGENVLNFFTLTAITEKSFEIVVESEALGKALGKGIKDERKIAWEFKGHPDFEGFEVYEWQEEEHYTVHAEYVSPDQHRTIINGRLWKKFT